MPELIVRGVKINYEVFGSRGPWIALTPGSRRAYGELAGLAKRIAADDFRVLLHDRRNCGSSEVAFDGSASEHEVWADDLFELTSMLGAQPLYVGGSSAGARLAILFAIRHPSATAGLLLWRVTGGQHAVDTLSKAYYGDFIEIAKAGGMAAVCESPHFRDCISRRPSNRARLMAMDADDFIRVMETWREQFLKSAKLPIVGATEEQLRGMTFAACIIMGNDVIHTPETARRIHDLIKDSELHDDVVQKRSGKDLLQDWDQKEWAAAEGRMSEIFVEFLRRKLTKGNV